FDTQDRAEKNKDDRGNKKMEQDCPKDDECEGKRTGKLHRSIKLLEALDTKRWPSYEEAEQGQTVCCFEQGLEQQSLLEQRCPLRDILVEEVDRAECTNQGNVRVTTSSLTDGRIVEKLGSRVEVTQSGQSKRNGSIALRVTPFRTFLKEQADYSTLDRNGQQLNSIQSEQMSCSNLPAEANRSNPGENRSNADPCSCISHSLSRKHSPRFAFQTREFRRLFSERRGASRSPDSAEGETHNRHVREQEKQEILKVHECGSGQLGRSAGLSLGSLANRDSIPTPTNSIDLSNSVENRIGRSESFLNSLLLACSTLMAGSCQSDVKVHDTRQKRGRSETTRTNEESQKASTTRKNDGLIDRGNKREELFRWTLRRRSFSELAVKKVIGGWHNATDANQTACLTAIGMLFKLQGVPKDKIDGLELRQIMKKPQAAQRKPIREEPIWHFDELLRYVQSKSSTRDQLSEFKYLVITLALIMGYSTLRLAEIHRATAKRMRDESWKIVSSMRKVHDSDVEITLRPLKNPSVCPTTWLSGWVERRKNKSLKKGLWWLSSKNREVSYEEMSKAVHQTLLEVGIPSGSTVTSIRKSSMTKSISQGATKTQINRATRHKKGTDTVAHLYNQNLNDDLREKLSNFE
ncbi:MAG: hypothetical protein EZS28_026639, partial [Streblomastix strix]